LSDVVSSASQWIRACSLVVADMQGNGIELAGPDAPQILRIRFSVLYETKDTPASMKARVYNLSATTVERIRGLATQNGPTLTGLPRKTSAQVVLKAGYQQNFGQLFLGQIYQLRMGKESNVDSYIDIFAADGDLAHDWAIMRKSLAKGFVSEDLLKHYADSMSPWQTSYAGPPDGLQSQASPRGKVMFGMTRDYLSDFCDTNNCTWNIYQNQLQVVPKFSVRPGEAVVINSRTGQIGVPEQTENGVSVMCLLNPAITWGTRIKLTNTEIAQFALSASGLDSGFKGMVSPNVAYGNQGAWVPPLNTDGDYVCLYVEHHGDTRGDEWYTRITALSSNPSDPIPKAVTNIDIPDPLVSSSISGPQKAQGAA
jgi:hypothetical protein